MKNALLFVGLVWLVYGIDLILPADLFIEFGMIPRDLSRIWAVGTVPFLHRDWEHVLSNSIPLLILITLIHSVRRTWETIVGIMILSGGILWVCGRSTMESGTIAVHAGASGLVFGLIGYFLAAGIFTRRPLPILTALIVGILYGGTLLYGVVPQTGVSWDGHLFGAIAGVLVAYFNSKDEEAKVWQV